MESFGRIFESYEMFGAGPNARSFATLSIRSGGSLMGDTHHYFRVRFTGNQETASVFTTSLIFPEKKLLSGASVRLVLRGWKVISYFAFGLMCGQEYRHIKVMHPRQNHEFILDFSEYDLICRVQNGTYDSRAVMADGVKLFLKGIPSSEGGEFEVKSLAVFKEVPYDFRVILSSGVQRFSEIVSWWHEERPKPPPRELRELLFNFDRKYLRNYKDSADYFMTGRGISFGIWFTDSAAVATPILSSLLDAVSHNNTFRYSYHALKHVNSLLMVVESEGKIEPLFAARELLTDWLDANLFGQAQDKKYTWYDHGTAERQMVFLRMWHLGLTYGFDVRFMGRLLFAIKQQGDLLASEAFYARDQRSRYHNHALFQDLALLATAIALPWLESASAWKSIAIERIKDQIDNLFVIDGDFAVLKENSTGYHNGCLRIIEFLAGLLQLAGETEWYNYYQDLLEKTTRFTKVITYPGGRLPAIGDTARRANSADEAIQARKCRLEYGFWALDKAGYVVAKGSCKQVPFQFTFYAPSLGTTHKHADHLSFTLFFDGVEWLIDPSFFSHQYSEPLPAYLRGPLAHNALVLPGIEYSIEPNTAWLHSDFDGRNFRVVGAHESYQDAVITRTVTGCLDDLDLRFEDCCRTAIVQKEACLLFHLGESVTARPVEDGYVLESCLSEHRLKLQLPAGCESKVHVGSRNSQSLPGLGWAATGFLEVHPIVTISCTVPLNSPVTWRLCVAD